MPARLGARRPRDGRAAVRDAFTRRHPSGTVPGPSRHRTATFRGRNLSLRLYGDARDDASGSARHDLPAPRAGDARRARARADADDQLDQLRFLHEVARLATTARTWDELLETVVDGTRDALHADVSSLYLLDRDGAYLTLAATNGLDRFQIGRARVPFGEGVTGRVAATREPLVIPDVQADPRFLWVRGIDQRRFVASMLSVPLSWHDQTVGVLNVQTEQTADVQPDHDVAQLGAVADLLAGIVEKGRQQSEAEARVEALKAIDEARSELIALVTHELRTPLAVVRAYADLLADEPPLRGPRVARHRAARDARGLAPARRSSRSSGSTASSTRSSPRSGSCPEGPASVTPVDVEALVARGPRLARAAPRQPPGRRRAERPAARPGRPAAAPPDRRAPRRERRQVRAARDDDHGSTGRSIEGVVRLGISDEGPGIPDEWRERIFEPYARRDTHTARGSGIGLYAAKRLGESMGAHLWCEPARPHGARFVVALPAAVAV